ncbi:MAG: UvrD-helicase domain-containing protein [Lachnospiraceae bacterium]|nr:UvrD-helicase domain-containing protein [Lachnospiraceae bacterium]
MGILDGLNDKQYEAAAHVDGPQLIIAGAGSGKTRVLTHRIAYLIDACDVNPYNIMAITFTNKAAGEMRERVDRMGCFGAESVWVMTFHSTCVRILRRYIDRIGYDTNFTIYDSDDSKSLMKAVFKKLKIDPKFLKEASVLREIGRAKDELLGPTEYEEKYMADFSKRQYVECYKEYQTQLRNNNALDFDDLIRMTVYLFKDCPDVLDSYQERFKYIMVDEYQDTNTAQFELVRLLASKYRNLCVVGDDDQSIYKFRGANIMNILNFEKVYTDAKVVKLEQNYRSTPAILNAANAVIQNNKGRKDKALWTDREEEELVKIKKFPTGLDEAREVVAEMCKRNSKGIAPFGDNAILYRTNAQSRVFEEQLVREGVPYKLVGGVNFYARKEVKDLLAYLKAIDNAKHDLQVKRIINVPKRGIGDTTVQKVQDFADDNRMDFYEALTLAEQIPGLNKAAAKLVNFTEMISHFRETLREKGIAATFKELLADTAYEEEIIQADEENSEDRLQNINELFSKVVAFEEENPEGTLSEFLEETALVSDLDSLDENVSAVTLMTIHSAKGLEFPSVYLVGMEDGVFPSYMTINSESEEDLEEERRLAYVAITRAQDRLQISYATSRMIRGETQYNPKSRFLREIPAKYCEGETGAGDDYTAAKTSTYLGTATRSKAMDELHANPYALKPGFVPKKRQGLYGNKSVSQSKPVTFQTGAALAVGEKPAYEEGDRVRHIKFGEGTVFSIVKGPRDYQVTVDFDQAGRKIMYAAFAKLQKI